MVGVDAMHLLSAALDMAVVVSCQADLLAACQDAYVILLALPVLAAASILKQLAQEPRICNSIITDVGSVKSTFLKAAQQAFGKLPAGLVPGHPIAGSERSGVTAANAELFQQHKVILTPHAGTDPQALALVTQLWQCIGADVEHMTVEQHDLVLAATSHLPHLLAFGLVDSLARRDENLDIFRYAAGGFRDFTRIAASDPQMWHDIFLSNRDAVLQQLDALNADLQDCAKRCRRAMALTDGFTRARYPRTLVRFCTTGVYANHFR